MEVLQFPLNVRLRAAQPVQGSDHQGVTTPKQLTLQGLVAGAVRVLAAGLVGDYVPVRCSHLVEGFHLSCQVLPGAGYPGIVPGAACVLHVVFLLRGVVGVYGHIILYVSGYVKIFLGHFSALFSTLWDTFRGVGRVSQIVYILGHAGGEVMVGKETRYRHRHSPAKDRCCLFLPWLGIYSCLK